MKKNIKSIIIGNIGEGGANNTPCYIKAIEEYYSEKIETVERDLEESRESLLMKLRKCSLNTENENRVWDDGYVQGFSYFCSYLKEMLENENLMISLQQELQNLGDIDNLYRVQAIENCGYYEEELSIEEEEDISDTVTLIQDAVIETEKEFICFISGWARGFELANKEIYELIK